MPLAPGRSHDVTRPRPTGKLYTAPLRGLKPAKVGAFKALFYESMIPWQLDKEIKWHWVCIVDKYSISSSVPFSPNLKIRSSLMSKRCWRHSESRRNGRSKMADNKMSV